MEKVTKHELEDKIEYRNSDGELHREDGPAIEYDKGHKIWYKSGVLHREDGPAVEYDKGRKKIWVVNGKFHREDGPAFEYANGLKKWYINDKELTEQEFNKWVENNEKREGDASKTFKQDFTHESKIITSINDFKQYLKNK